MVSEQTAYSLANAFISQLKAPLDLHLKEFFVHSEQIVT